MSLAKPYVLVSAEAPTVSAPPLVQASPLVFASHDERVMTKSPTKPWPALPKSPPFRVG